MLRLKGRKVHDDERHTVVVVDSVEVRSEKNNDMLGLFVRSVPVAVVIRTANGAYAIDLDAEPLELDSLIAEVADLGALLER